MTTSPPAQHVAHHFSVHHVLNDGNVHHPSVIEIAKKRGASIQLRVADAITAFAGSMRFVYVHAIVFAAWMLFFEKSPWPTLTLVVSLEAIFLSTFVMIGQNRQASFQQSKADHDFVSTEQELSTNTELTKKIAELAATIEQLTRDIHGQVVVSTEPASTDSGAKKPGTSSK